MPDAALLHQNQLAGFKTWLSWKGYEWRDSLAKWQVIQIKWGSGWQAIYQREAAAEHLSVPAPLIPLVRAYIRDGRKAAIEGTTIALDHLRGSVEPIDDSPPWSA